MEPRGGDSLREARQNLEILFEEKVPIFASGPGSPAFILEPVRSVMRACAPARQ